jgi:hypothetical protein
VEWRRNVIVGFEIWSTRRIFFTESIGDNKDEYESPITLLFSNSFSGEEERVGLCFSTPMSFFKDRLHINSIFNHSNHCLPFVGFNQNMDNLIARLSHTRNRMSLGILNKYDDRVGCVYK